MNKIICDSFESSTKERFKHGFEMNCVDTPNVKLNYKQVYNVLIAICLSAVKRTLNNWFYIFKADKINVEFVSKWLKEIKPIFPHFDIKLYKDDAGKHLSNFFATAWGMPYIQYSNPRNSNDYISINLHISAETAKRWHLPKEVKVGCLHILSDNLIYYMVDKDIVEGKTEDIVNEYVDTNFDLIKESFKDANSNASISGEVTMWGMRTYSISTKNAILQSSITAEGIKKYLIDLCLNGANWREIIRVVKIRIQGKAKNDIYIIKALYSKKKFMAEAYLAHHLIRAGVSPEHKEFIAQYYKIKEALPELPFWSRIMLTQFGFKFYYYYWLTDTRIFKLPSVEEWDEWCNKCTNYNSKIFLDHFTAKIPASTRDRLVELYKEERFQDIVDILSKSIIVRLKAEKKTKFINLRLHEEYPISSFDENYYYIVGDDYAIRRYSRKSFIA